MADLENLADPEDIALLRGLIEQHWQYTGSEPARRILADWPAAQAKFRKAMPRDYRRVLAARKQAREGREMEVANG